MRPARVIDEGVEREADAPERPADRASRRWRAAKPVGVSCDAVDASRAVRAITYRSASADVGVFGHKPNTSSESDMKELAQVPIFRRAGVGELEQLGSVAKRETFKPNTVVFFQEDRADKLYVILSGGAKVYQQAEDGKQKIIGILGQADIFGERTLLDGRERSATVETIDQTEMLSIAHRDFHALATKNPEILWRVMEVLCERIRGLNEETLNLAFEELPYRIVQALDE